MMTETRTKNVTRNAIFGLFSQMIRILLEFIVRTIFINKLGSEYLGLNGLFTNVLTILSFAELGIGNAITFSMYKEIANNDTKKVQSLMNLYRKTYNIIGLVILVLGLSLTPFITYMISGIPKINENIYLIYILFLLNSALSYFFSYKKSIISAHQKEYILNISKLIAEIVKVCSQIAILVFTRNFILYLIIQLICMVLDNVITYVIANKMYPYIKDKNIEELQKKEKDSIFNNVKSLVMYKFGSIILNGTDNIIISKMLGLATVGLFSNYNLIVSTCTTLIGTFLNGFTASIGNLNVDDNIKKQEKVFEQLFLICVIIFGVVSITLYLLINDFIVLWIGEEYVLSNITVFVIVLNFYVNGVQNPGYQFRTTSGLFNEGKYTPIISAVINIVLSIVMGLRFGLAGIIIATAISRLCTTTWYDIYMVYKIKFKKTPLKIYIKYLLYFMIVLINGIINYYVLSLININGFMGFIVKGIICTILSLIIFIIIFINTKEFRNIVARMKGLLWKKNVI